MVNFMRELYEEQLKTLYEEIAAMGKLCEEAIYKTTKALTEGDVALADEIIAGDADINQQQRDLETTCFKIILKQQPIAGDLRRISAIIKLLTDLERIGDQAADIADIVKKTNLTLPDKYMHICDMGNVVIEMIAKSIQAYVNSDLTLAQSVIAQDDVVDDLFLTVRGELLKELSSGEHANGELLLDLFMITKYYEKTADHATNVAEWVCYAITGERV